MSIRVTGNVVMSVKMEVDMDDMDEGASDD